MKIFDNSNILLEEYNEKDGYLKKDKIFVCHHERVEGVEEVGHWKTVAEYSNGGKDVEWIIDVPAVQPIEPWDEYEEILRFIPFTPKEKATNRIQELKSKLNETDYNIIKIVEGAASISEMTSIISQRAEWRKEINELQAEFEII